MARRKRRHHEEHQNHEAWAIPYGDLITLLLAFFVVMYAVSSVNEGKYHVLSNAMYAAFRGSPRSIDPVQVGERLPGAQLGPKPAQDDEPASAATPVRHGIESTANQPAEGASAATMQKMAADVEHAMSDLVRANLVAVHRNATAIEVEIRADLLFPSGSARLADSAVRIIERLAAALKPYANAIRVEGHTDDRPIVTAEFPSNWELSSARAASVVHLFADTGVAPERLAVIGMGQYRPIKPNVTAEGRTANRRVVIVIESGDGNGIPDAHAAAPATVVMR